MIGLSWDMRQTLGADTIHFVVGPRYFQNDKPMDNYLPEKLRKGFVLNGFFTPPHIVGLCGKMLKGGVLVDTVPEDEWSDVISHETIHYVLFKYVGGEAQAGFDRVCLCFNLYNFSQRGWWKNWLKKKKNMEK